MACESMNKDNVESRLLRVDNHCQTCWGNCIVMVPGGSVHYAEMVSRQLVRTLPEPCTRDFELAIKRMV